MARRRSRRLLVTLSLVMIILAPVACGGSGSNRRGMARNGSRALVRDFAERRAVRVRDGPARAAVGAGAAWVTTERGVARVGTHSLHVSGPHLVLGHRPADIAFAFGRLWV